MEVIQDGEAEGRVHLASPRDATIVSKLAELAALPSVWYDLEARSP